MGTTPADKGIAAAKAVERRYRLHWRLYEYWYEEGAD